MSQAQDLTPQQKLDFQDFLLKTGTKERVMPDQSKEECYCDMKSVVFPCTCPLCGVEFESTTKDDHMIKNQHCPRHKLRITICGWPRPLCTTCAQDWTIMSGHGGATTLTNRRTGKKIFPEKFCQK